MSFSAATCLTDTPFGVTSFNVYLGQNNYASPNLIASLVPVSDLTDNCPYIINNIPDGTTYLSFKDSSGTYCISIPIQDNNICSNCDLGFSNYSATTINKIYCGVLTGSCQTNITDYLIHWYGPDDTTTLSFTSGGGSIFSYQYQHPFSTEPTSIPVISGVYTPVIQNVILNGVSYSNNGGVGTILFSGNCLPTTTVSPFTCVVRTNTDISYPYSAYTNYVSFSSISQGSPTPFNFTYEISANTKYIAWAFKGVGIPDRITIELDGDLYSDIIGIDDFKVGNNLNFNNFTPSTYPKEAKTPYYFTKISCLTGVTVSDGDKLNIKITPATSQTDWYLYMTCLEDYNCNDCLLTQDYKIIGSSITGITGSCDTLNVNFDISGCPSNDITSDYITYFNNTLNQLNNLTPILSPDRIINQSSGSMAFEKSKCIRSGISLSTPNLPICTSDISATTYNKTFLTDGSGRGVFGFTGSSTFISTYYTSFLKSFSGLTPYASNWTGSTNSTDLSYYRYYNLRIPSQTSPDNCGDPGTGTNYIDIKFHQTSQIITGVTGTKYYLSVTANTISNNISFSECQEGCNSIVNSVIKEINEYSTGATPTFGTSTRTFNNGIYYTNPIFSVNIINNPNGPITVSPKQGFFRTNDWWINTYPFSGDPSLIIPSFSGTICNYNSTGVKKTEDFSFYNQQYKYYYEVRITNPLNINDFDIWASPISNFSYSGAPSVNPFYELAYRNSGGTITTNSTYII